LLRGIDSIEAGGTMHPIGSTKRKFGDIWGQLAVSFCVLLVPPLLMAAGMTYLGSPPAQSEAQASPAAIVDTGSRPNVFARPDDGPGTSLAAASAEQRPSITVPHPPVEQPADMRQAAAARSTETTNDMPAAERPSAATRKVARIDPQKGHGLKRQRTLSDLFPFLRPSSR
jgi:hypothetical protein